MTFYPSRFVFTQPECPFAENSPSNGPLAHLQLLIVIRGVDIDIDIENNNRHSLGGGVLKPKFTTLSPKKERKNGTADDQLLIPTRLFAVIRDRPGPSDE
jgi:hypothetical protein